VQKVNRKITCAHCGKSKPAHVFPFNHGVPTKVCLDCRPKYTRIQKNKRRKVQHQRKAELEGRVIVSHEERRQRREKREAERAERAQQQAAQLEEQLRQRPWLQPGLSKPECKRLQLIHLTPEQLREWLRYDEMTGLWFDRLGQPAGSLHTNSRGHRRWRVSFEGVVYTGARLAVFYVTGSWPPRGQSIMHKNRDTTDDRFDNLDFGAMQRRWAA
jgi:hypothetical protein